jgi:hypothetical protein
LFLGRPGRQFFVVEFLAFRIGIDINDEGKKMGKEYQWGDDGVEFSAGMFGDHDCRLVYF